MKEMDKNIYARECFAASTTVPATTPSKSQQKVLVLGETKMCWGSLCLKLGFEK